jgi:hypothetical protein
VPGCTETQEHHPLAANPNAIPIANNSSSIVFRMPVPFSMEPEVKDPSS